ncbi:MerR family transcriptional regulator [Streptomyces bobili]|uniref:MerR family transcriptional regulator n=1 Tax=Streptomyces bobili TaxID=67280 RepID=UPI0033D93970
MGSKVSRRLHGGLPHLAAGRTLRCSATTLRFYETAGLLPAERTASGFRVYGEDAVDRLAFISSAKLLGLALEEIRELLDVREEGVCASARARTLPLIADRSGDTDGRVAELRAFSWPTERVSCSPSPPPSTASVFVVTVGQVVVGSVMGRELMTSPAEGGRARPPAA